jgi:hypothetical protein
MSPEQKQDEGGERKFPMSFYEDNKEHGARD